MRNPPQRLGSARRRRRTGKITAIPTGHDRRIVRGAVPAVRNPPQRLGNARGRQRTGKITAVLICGDRRIVRRDIPTMRNLPQRARNAGRGCLGTSTAILARSVRLAVRCSVPTMRNPPQRPRSARGRQRTGKITTVLIYGDRWIVRRDIPTVRHRLPEHPGSAHRRWAGAAVFFRNRRRLTRGPGHRWCSLAVGGWDRPRGRSPPLRRPCIVAAPFSPGLRRPVRRRGAGAAAAVLLGNVRRNVPAVRNGVRAKERMAARHDEDL